VLKLVLEAALTGDMKPAAFLRKKARELNSTQKGKKRVYFLDSILHELDNLSTQDSTHRTLFFTALKEIERQAMRKEELPILPTCQCNCESH